MTVHTSIGHIILIFLMTVVGVFMIGIGFLVYDIITAVRAIIRSDDNDADFEEYE